MTTAVLVLCSCVNRQRACGTHPQRERPHQQHPGGHGRLSCPGAVPSIKCSPCHTGPRSRLSSLLQPLEKVKVAAVSSICGRVGAEGRPGGFCRGAGRFYLRCWRTGIVGRMTQVKSGWGRFRGGFHAQYVTISSNIWTWCHAAEQARACRLQNPKNVPLVVFSVKLLFWLLINLAHIIKTGV